MNGMRDSLRGIFKNRVCALPTNQRQSDAELAGRWAVSRGGRQQGREAGSRL